MIRKLFRGASAKATTSQGMTFIELIVVLGIFAAIAGTVLFNYRDFSENVNLKNLAQNIALQVKRAQTEAVSGRQPVITTNQLNDGALPVGWKPSFGIAVNIEDNTTDVDNKRFFYYFNRGLTTDSDYFQDMNDFEGGNSYLQPCGAEPTSECLEEIVVTGGEFIDSICLGFDDITADNCDGTESDRVYLSFTRPRSNATIIETGGGTSYPNAYIRISSPQGRHKYIAIWESGYISIK